MTQNKDLSGRQEREREFHDRWAGEVDAYELDPARLAACPTTPETSWALAALGDLAGRRVLDLGCGYGETAVWLALQGAVVDAVDISPGMVEVSRRLAERCGVPERIRFHVAPGESLPFEEGAFDLVFGHDVLHHLDLDLARGELLRVLKPGGRAVFAEPLGHNPLINLFRDRSPGTRTPDEMPLRFSDFARLRSGFCSLTHREFQLFTLALFLWFYLVERADPNKERYWKKIIVEADRYRRAFGVLNAIDRALLAVFPPAGRLCRMTVLVLQR
ncbi:MAG TPA: methyltransferase domain-containing protein [Candidatus Polarisedimenticolia bacterium]|nr:methyltransferase domain-containing protein [Candidatus Polarisedimenticolia bacterium]